MGLDFVRRVAKSFKKKWDRGREELATPDLFTQHPELKKRRIVIRAAPGCKLEVNQEYLVRVESENIMVYKGENFVGAGKGCPSEVRGTIESSGGYAVAKVEQVHPLSGAADVTLK